jgi:hypothetical protein
MTAMSVSLCVRLVARSMISTPFAQVFKWEANDDVDVVTGVVGAGIADEGCPMGLGLRPTAALLHPLPG